MCLNIFVMYKFLAMINRKLQVTDDGSHTLFSQKTGENYHSSFGAVQESRHIFMNAGLEVIKDEKLKQLNVLEVGVGTGLNALLTYLWTLENNVAVAYYGYEPYPITADEATMLNYADLLKVDQSVFLKIHEKTNEVINLSEKFSVCISNSMIQKANLKPNSYNVVFFDAFSPEAQPEMWTVSVFKKVYMALKKNGVLTTYSCKGIVKRSLKEAGFEIEKLPGPPGKREFLRAWKK